MNIVGEGFPKEIINQVYTRQRIYGSGYSNGISRTPEEILYLNANSSWCKLVSSTDIDRLDIINNPTIKKLNLSGTELAKKFVLFNGTANEQGLNSRAGIDLENSLTGNDKAYGIGGTEFGIRPMMGIQSVSVTHENRGSLRQASVKLKAWNKAQFEIIDVLYLRLGFSVLLEWGNSIYFDNNYVLQTKVNNSLADEFLNGNLTYNSFLKKIQTNRLTSFGNYDAMFAKVKNFSWSFQKDGSYDITLDLISSGDVIESLKVNALIEDAGGATTNAVQGESDDDKPTENDNEIITYYATKHSIGQFFWFLRYQIDFTEFGKEDASQTLYKTFSFTDYTTTPEEQNSSIETGNTVNTVTKFLSPVTWGLAALSNWAFDTEFLVDKPPLPVGIDKKMFEVFDTKGNLLKVNDVAQIAWDDKEGNDETYYIRFGTFLAYLQNYLMPKQLRNGADPKTQAEPILNFDYDQNTNLMYTHKWQVGVDPRICTVGRTINMISGLFWDSWQDVSFSSLCSPFIHPDYSDISEGVEYGNIMNIYVNMIYILNKIDELKDDKGKISLFDLLKGICDGINEGLGGINSLEPVIDETTNTIKIVDTNPLPNVDAVISKINNFPLTKKLNSSFSTELVSFDLYGYSVDSTTESAPIYNGLGHASFIKDFSFTTEITPEYATMVTVGAAANGSVVGENQTALSKLNIGLSDRYKKEVLDIYELKKRQQEKQDNIQTQAVDASALLDSIKERYVNTLIDYFDWLEEISDFPPEIIAKSEPTLDVDQVDAHKGVLLNIIQYQEQYLETGKRLILLKKGIDPNDPDTQARMSPGTGFIPFNLSITTDGLSGMKIYSKFTIDSSYLPSNYPNNVEFLIKGIHHEIADNKWTTKLESFCISKGNFTEETKQGPNTSPNNDGTSSPNVPATTTTDGFVKTLTSGFDLAKKSFSQKETNKTQIYLHHTAGSQKADKGKSVVDTYNDRTSKGNAASTHAAIDKDGHIEYLFEDKYVSFHAGAGQISQNLGLSVELEAYGCLTQRGGEFYNAYGGKVPADQAALAVDINGNPKPYKGFAYYHKYTPAQIAATKKLILNWASKHNIPVKWEGSKTFNQMFYPSGTITKVGTRSVYKDSEASKGIPGLYTHNSVRADKTDVFPQKELIEMFKTL